MSLIKNLFGKKDSAEAEGQMMVHIEGMSCNHCRENVEKTIKGLKGVSAVEVDLPTGVAIIHGNVDIKAVRKAVEGIGFKLKD